MEQFLQHWANAAYTSVGFFWMAFWAFSLGYIISSMIQIFVTEDRMQKAMGKDNFKSITLGTFFGFISSSCSFSALATTKSLFQKGAGFIASIAFLLASTNLVIELGVIISIFLGWQFVFGEYLGGILLIIISTVLIKIIRPKKLIQQAKAHLDQSDETMEHMHHHHGHEMHQHEHEEEKEDNIRSLKSWFKVGKQYGMEWNMVWKDVTIGFTIAGIVSAFVPDSFFQTLFIDSGATTTEFGFFTLLEHVLVGPVAAFLTFIGSMGNIPLAALLYDHAVSFAGVMAFIFSDLVVFPVLRINAKYYGWKMSLFMLFLLFTSLVVTSLLLHYGFAAFDLLPQGGVHTIQDNEPFQLNYTFFLNIAFVFITGVLMYWSFTKKSGQMRHNMASQGKVLETVLKYIAFGCYAWLIVGLGLKFFL